MSVISCKKLRYIKYYKIGITLDEILSGEDDFNLVVEFCVSSSHDCKYDAVVPITKFIFLI